MGEGLKKQQRQSESLTPREGWNSWMIALHLPGEASGEEQPSGDWIHIGQGIHAKIRRGKASLDLGE